MGSEELTIPQILDLSFPFLLLILTYWFASRHFWPWYTGPHQERRDAQWKAEHEAQVGRESLLRDIMRDFTETLKAQQNGLMSAVEGGKTEILAAIGAAHSSTQSTVSSVGSEMINYFGENNRRLDEWRKDIAHLIRIQHEHELNTLRKENLEK